MQHLRTPVVVLALTVATAHCGGDDTAMRSETGTTADTASETIEVTPIDTDPGDADAGDGAAETTTAPPDADSPHGLDERPTNTTCLAFARPPVASDGDIGVIEAFPNMDFGSSAIGLKRLRMGPAGPMRWFVLDRSGFIWTFVSSDASKDGLAADGTTPVERAEQFLDLPENVYGTGEGEGGLLGFAFDPDFALRDDANYVYVHYTTWPANNVWRFRVGRSGNAWAVTESKRIFVTESGGGNHWGGDLAFGPDGFLYVSLGDGGNGMNPSDVRKTSWLRGKILRIDPRSAGGDVPYAIPASNPFASNPLCQDRDLANNTVACPEIFATGFRNPWRMTFDRETGRLWVGDVGSDKEEVNVVVAGQDYGWNDCSGRGGAHCPPGDAASPYIAPILQYRVYNAASVAGGFVYRGTALGAALQGAYIFADVYGGEILIVDKPYEYVTFEPTFRVSNIYEHPDEPDDDDLPRFRKLATPQLPFPVSWAEDENAELYVVTFASGKGQAIYKIVPATASLADTVPTLLSETGCVDPSDPRKPAAGLVPYDLNAPFWSDGAEKHRWLALPAGTTMTIGADGDWELPIGAVVMKEFRLGGARIETRLMLRHADGGWAGYSWVWREDESDAVKANAAGETRAIGDEIWHYPSRTGCMGCHTVAAGGTLGLETAQLNRVMTYPTTGRSANQLETYAHIGFFAGPLPAGGADTLPAFVSPFGDAPLAERARTYLHANCAQCHRAGRVPDLRYGTPMADTGLCTSDRVHPGDPATSRLATILSEQDPAVRMPKGAGTVIDAAGVALIESWISSLTTCP